MNRFSNEIAGIAAELASVINQVDQTEFDAFIAAITNARRIALHGVGREGLMMKALAMRLHHLRYDVGVVGDMTAPHLGAGDLLILSAGPGFFHTVDGLRQVAQRDGAKVICLTATPDGKTPLACDEKLVLPAQTMATDEGSQATSILPMGSLYELAQFVFGEIVVLELLRRTGKTMREARDRHTNLE
jgi:6-phospho-3-hexuloisomerase